MTIYDIAQEAGVSPATVSRVLTNKANVSPEKREAVTKLIRKYHFRPNELARGLSDARRRVLGMLVADVRNPYYAAMVVECEKAAKQYGYSVMLCNMLNEPCSQKSILERMRSQQVDAVIQLGGETDQLVTNPAYAAQVRELSVPFITSGKLDGTDCYMLHIDESKNMHMIMDYLYQLGHRDIAVVGGTEKAWATHNKNQRYLYLLGQYGLPFREGYIQQDDYTLEGGMRCMEALLQLPQPPTAVIAVNDYTAVGIVRSALEHGIRVPQDLSVLSHDNTFLSEIISPKLTSLDYDCPAAGAKFVEVAMAAVNGEPVPHRQFLKTRLVVRESCAPPPKKSE